MHRAFSSLKTDIFAILLMVFVSVGQTNASIYLAIEGTEFDPNDVPPTTTQATNTNDAEATVNGIAALIQGEFNLFSGWFCGPLMVTDDSPNNSGNVNILPTATLLTQNEDLAHHTFGFNLNSFGGRGRSSLSKIGGGGGLGSSGGSSGGGGGLGSNVLASNSVPTSLGVLPGTSVPGTSSNGSNSSSNSSSSSDSTSGTGFNGNSHDGQHGVTDTPGLDTNTGGGGTNNNGNTGDQGTNGNQGGNPGTDPPNNPTPSVPEPTSLILFALGSVGLMSMRRRG